MTEDEIDGLKVKGLDECINPYVEKMVKYWMKTKKNFYSFLLTMNDDELDNIACALMIEEGEEEGEEEDMWRKIGVHLSMMAHFMEIGRDGKSFEANIEELIDIPGPFSVMCSLALREKQGRLRVTDDSYFFDYKNEIKIEMLRGENGSS